MYVYKNPDMWQSLMLPYFVYNSQLVSASTSFLSNNLFYVANAHNNIIMATVNRLIYEYMTESRARIVFYSGVTDQHV